MQSISGILIAVGVIAVVALALVGLASAWRRLARRSGELPLTGMLRQAGLSEGEVQAAAGSETVATAARRCALCGSYEECGQRVAEGTPPPADCPNAALFAELGRPRA